MQHVHIRFPLWKLTALTRNDEWWFALDGADVPVSSTGRRMWLPDGRRMVLPDIINPGFAELAEDAAYVEEDE